MNSQPVQERKDTMSKARAWIAVVVVGHLAACSSTFKQLSPTPSGGGEPSGRAGPFLNSPFFITVVGGLGVGAITSLYTHYKSKHDKEMAADNARREKQTAVLSSVANDLPVYISTMGSMRQLRVWLETHANSDDKDDLGRQREEVLKEYAEFFKLYLKTKGEVAILTEVISFYRTQEVCDMVNKEDLAIHKIHDAKDRPDRLEAVKAQEEVFASLLIAMAEEISPTPKKGAEQKLRLGPCPLPKN